MDQQQNIDELEPLLEDSQFNLSEYLHLLRRRLKWIVIVALGFAGCAYVWSIGQTPIYVATASVVIESEAPQLLPTGQETGRFDAEEFQTHVNLMTSFPK